MHLRKKKNFPACVGFVPGGGICHGPGLDFLPTFGTRRWQTEHHPTGPCCRSTTASSVKFSDNYRCHLSTADRLNPIARAARGKWSRKFGARGHLPSDTKLSGNDQIILELFLLNF